MKVLYVGHYREGFTGWGQATIDSILALDKAGVDIVCRPIILNKIADIPDRIKELENKSIDGSTICIQHVLPHYMEYNSKVKNVGMFYMETSTCKFTSWESKLAKMDELWVPNSSAHRYASSINKARIIPVPADLNKYSYSNTINLPNIYDSYKFYSIIDLNYRKNLPDLLRAFHTAFSKHEPVDLVLKVNGSKEDINKICEAVRLGLKLHARPNQYKQEIIISGQLSQDQIYGLHNACDCYVSTSYNEGWCMPLFDAMGFGNQVLTNWCDGSADFVPRECTVDSIPDSCFNMTNTFNDMYTGYETWEKISVPNLIDKMRFQYEYGERNPAYDLSEYSYENVGQKMKEYLCAL